MLCVCVCVFLGSMCLKLLLRDDFERFIWCLDHWLCCIFDCIHVSIFLFSKNYFKNLLNTSLTPGYLSSFQALSYCNLNTSSTPSGSIEKVPVSSITSWQLGWSIELLFLIWWFVPWHMLDTCICWWPFSQHLPWQIAWHLSTPSSVEID